MPRVYIKRLFYFSVSEYSLTEEPRNEDREGFQEVKRGPV